MSTFGNKRKEKYLASFPPVSLDDKENNLTERCKFNFSFLDESQPPSQKLENLTLIELQKFIIKLKEFSRHSLTELQRMNVGSGKHKWNLFEIYGSFPKKSDFTHPSHVPHQANWARFRMNYEFRLVGFVVPEDFHGRQHSRTKEYFDQNTFYIVFIDMKHGFYKK